MRLILCLIIYSFFVFPVYADESKESDSPPFREGAGLIFSDLQGALPKALWRDQNRSEIITLIRSLPNESTRTSIQQIKKNMLLSAYESSLIKEDQDRVQGDDLLTVRLNKLFEMGLWYDALKLYTNTIEHPSNNEPLARIGIMLLLAQKGIASACLEEKVVGSPFAEKTFWRDLAALCRIETGESEKETFGESSVLQAIYHNNDFVVPATDISVLKKLSTFELLMLSKKKRIIYDKNAIEEEIPSFLTALFLSDPQISPQFKEIVEKRGRELLILKPLPINDDSGKTANNDESQPVLGVLEIIRRKVKNNHPIDADLVHSLLENEEEKEQNIIYIQILNLLNLVGEMPKNWQEISSKTEESFNRDEKKKLIFLLEALDKSQKFSNNHDQVYEKQSGLTKSGENGLSDADWQNRLKQVVEQDFAGITLLIVLNNLNSFAEAGDSSNNNEESYYWLKSLSNVGLINQTHEIAKEELVHLMGNNK